MVMSVPHTGKSQSWQTLLSLDSRVGYSTNTYLNPFLGEWDPTVESGYGLTTFLGQSFWYNRENSVSMTGGLVYQPFINKLDAVKGGLALVDYKRRISPKFSVGVESGASYISTSFNRSQFWIQPHATWFASPFTLVRAKIGSNFRNFENFADSLDFNNRFELYALEVETWPGYQWQITGGLYGQLNTLPAIQEGFNSRVAVSYWLRNGASVTFSAGIEQYQFDETVVTDNPGGPPGVGPPPTTEEISTTDRIFRFGVNGSYPVNERFSVFGSVEALGFNSEAADESFGEFQASAGVRLSFQPRINRKSSRVEPAWEEVENSQMVSIRYSGDGRLYLVGNFNDWSKPGIPLREQSDNRYVAQLDLSTGMYEYKILRVTGSSEEWISFSDETYTVDDGFGGKNAIILIE